MSWLAAVVHKDNSTRMALGPGGHNVKEVSEVRSLAGGCRVGGSFEFLGLPQSNCFFSFLDLS